VDAKRLVKRLLCVRREAASAPNDPPLIVRHDHRSIGNPSLLQVRARFPEINHISPRCSLCTISLRRHDGYRLPIVIRNIVGDNDARPGLLRLHTN